MNEKIPENRQTRKKLRAIFKIWNRKNEQIVTDVNGSYTGTPEFGSVPEQDPDDL